MRSAVNVVACLFCGAAKGEVCRDRPSNAASTWSHLERNQAAMSEACHMCRVPFGTVVLVTSDGVHACSKRCAKSYEAQKRRLVKESKR